MDGWINAPQLYATYKSESQGAERRSDDLTRGSTSESSDRLSTLLDTVEQGINLLEELLGLDLGLGGELGSLLAQILDARHDLPGGGLLLCLSHDAFERHLDTAHWPQRVAIQTTHVWTNERERERERHREKGEYDASTWLACARNRRFRRTYSSIN